MFLCSSIAAYPCTLSRLQVDWSLLVKPCKTPLSWGGVGRGPSFLQNPLREGLDQSGCQFFTPPSLAGSYGRPPTPLNILTVREEKRRNKVSEDED